MLVQRVCRSAVNTTETKWLPFCRRHFQMNFLVWKSLYFDSTSTEICTKGSNSKYSSIGSGNGLTPNRREDIIWTNYGLVHWRITASLGWRVQVLGLEQNGQHFPDIFERIVRKETFCILIRILQESTAVTSIDNTNSYSVFGYKPLPELMFTEFIVTVIAIPQHKGSTTRCLKCQLCRHWHRRLSLWQPVVSPVTTTLALWQCWIFGDVFTDFDVIFRICRKHKEQLLRRRGKTVH